MWGCEDLNFLQQLFGLFVVVPQQYLQNLKAYYLRQLLLSIPQPLIVLSFFNYF